MKTVRTILPIVMALLMLAACGRDKEAEATPTAAPQAAESVATEVPTAAVVEATPTALPVDATAIPAAQVAIPSGDPQADILNAMAAQMGGGPYRATTTMDAGGTITEMTTEVVPPDSMHVTIGGGNLELLLIDGVLWSKSGETDWEQMGSPEMMQSIFDSVQNQFDAGSISNVQHVGTEPVFGEQTEVYSFTSTLGEGAEALTSEVKVWLSQTSGLPVRMESTGTVNEIPTHTVQSIEYDDTITITAPGQ